MYRMEKPYIVDFTPTKESAEKKLVKIPRPRKILDTVHEREALLIERHEEGYKLDQLVNLVWEPTLGDHSGGLISVFKRREGDRSSKK